MRMKKNILIVIIMFGSALVLLGLLRSVRRDNSADEGELIIDQISSLEEVVGKDNSVSDPVFRNVLEYSIAEGGDALLIYDMEEDETLIEDYHNGFGGEDAHILYSGSKSFSGVMLAALIDDGLIESFESPVSEVIFEWQGTDKASITYFDLLTLTSGIFAGDRGIVNTTVEEAILAPLEVEVGTRFAYGPNAFLVFGEVVRRLTDVEPEDYLQQRILDPLGVEVVRWERNSDGGAALDRGAYMVARDWLEFGKFMYRSIEFGESSLVNAQLMQELISSSDAYDAYGVTFWLDEDADVDPDRGGVIDFFLQRNQGESYEGRYFAAAGGLNQRLMFLPDENLLILRFASKRGGYSDSQFLEVLLSEE